MNRREAIESVLRHHDILTPMASHAAAWHTGSQACPECRKNTRLVTDLLACFPDAHLLEEIIAVATEITKAKPRVQSWCSHIQHCVPDQVRYPSLHPYAFDTVSYQTILPALLARMVCCPYCAAPRPMGSTTPRPQV